MFARDKDSSLLQEFVNYDCKKFNKIGPRSSQIYDEAPYYVSHFNGRFNCKVNNQPISSFLQILTEQ